MFGIQFYPTPPDIIKRMLDGVNWYETASILEPSAGKGDIAEAVSNAIKESRSRKYADVPDIDCVELDINLQHILRGKGLRVIHDDFMSLNTYKRYDLIIMNPPFHNGEYHLSKAIDMQSTGGSIVCLLNADTIQNQCTKHRRDLAERIAALDGSIEYIQDAFVGAERKTGVEIALIKINIPYNEVGESVLLDDLRKAKELEGVSTSGELISNDPFQELIDRYNFEAKCGLSLIREWCLMKPHISKDDSVSNPLLELKMAGHNVYGTATPNEYIMCLRDRYWHSLFALPAFTSKLTSAVRDSYMKELDTFKEYEFSAFNILTMRAKFSTQVISGIEGAIIELFEKLTYENAWSRDGHNSDNVHYYNGWATNKAWYINKKVIRPQYALVKSYDGTYRSAYSDDGLKELDDIEKVFSYLEGSAIGLTNTLARIKSSIDKGDYKNIRTNYFSVSFFKKGTCHIVFHDDDLLKKFNIYAGRHKKWLPPAYGTTSYADMEPDEQDVVDSFEGKEEYAKTFERKDYYLGSQSQLLLATT